MSIATSLTKLETDITNAYDAVQIKGGTIPSNKNTNNLATAISSISSGGGGKPEQSKTATPTTSSQTIIPDEGYTLSSVTVNAVDSSIDSNIQAENIKEGVSILGVEGSIRIPSGTIEITENGVVNVNDYSNANVNVPNFWTEPEIKDVNFIDYDGTILETWTSQETANKTELPSLPTHEYLIPHIDTNNSIAGWNWTLQSIKDYMQSNPDACLYVGTQYLTKDSATYVFVEVSSFTLNPYVSFAVNGTATIDWGDGTTDTVTGTSTSTRIDTPHTYSVAGNYVIKIQSDLTVYFSAVNNGGWTPTLFWNAVDWYGSVKYQNCVKTIYLGNCSLPNLSFFQLYGLEKLVLSADIQSVGGNNNFSSGQIQTFVIPTQISSMNTTTFSSKGVYCMSIPYNFKGVGAPTNLRVKTMSLPQSSTSVMIYNSSTAFSPSLSKITIPKNCAITSFGNYTFYQCHGLLKITVPINVATIGAQAFGNCFSLGEIHFTNSTPPTVTNSNAFDGVPTTCKIYVPTGYLNAYKTATNYPDSTVYTYIEE